MDEETTSKTSTELERWDYLFQEQSTIFRNTVTRNKVLEGEVEELRRELSVWKAAQKTADESAKLAERTISKLQRSLDAMKDDNPLVVCLIDGDGTIFSQDLWGLGQIGGRQAAMLLTKGITDHVVSSDEAVSNRCRIWLSIFCNKAGLMDVLQRNGVCNTTQFEEFFQGFNQASPLFSIIDVGNGKEAADSKIKEYLRVFTRFPQTSRVYFGGAHDNGYSSTLTFLENEGLLDKVVLLRGYKNLAFELQNIDLSHLEIEGLFMTQKLQATHSWKHITLTPPAHPVQLQDFEKFKTKSRATSDERKPTGKTLDPNQPLNKQKPPPCTFFYLSECRQGSKCRYGHDYQLSPENMIELKINAKKSPCPLVNKDQTCPDGDNCVSGHFCPRLSRCGFLKSGKCKFTGKDMHRETSRDSRSRRPGRKDRNAGGRNSDSPSDEIQSEAHTLSPLLGSENIEEDGLEWKPSSDVDFSAAGLARIKSQHYIL